MPKLAKRMMKNLKEDEYHPMYDVYELEGEEGEEKYNKEDEYKNDNKKEEDQGKGVSEE
ncbi:hypothetical protein KI387_018367, partial [Taxus chinensis]